MTELAQPFLRMVSTEPALPGSIIHNPLTPTGRRPKQRADLYDTGLHLRTPTLSRVLFALSRDPRPIARYGHPSKSPALLRDLPMFELR